jgi:hypothetical protein
MALLAFLSYFSRKCAGKTNKAAALTGDVLIEEFKAIHGVDLTKIYEQNNGPGTWTSFPTAAQDYDEKLGSGQRNALNSEEQEREQDKARQRYYFKHVHALKKTDKDPGQTALCLSGGGIRSAAFALGLIQGLARLGLLSQFHYFSTVSGGGYMGAWLTAWAHRAARSSKTFEEIENELGDLGKAPEPLRELRENQDYLTPKVGIGSPDTWAALAIVIRNLLLNWLVFLPLLVSVLLIPRILQGLLALSETIGARPYDCWA